MLKGTYRAFSLTSLRKFHIFDQKALRISHDFVYVRHHLADVYFVVGELPYEIIIGADFLQKWKIKLDPATEGFILDEKALEITLV